MTLKYETYYDTVCNYFIEHYRHGDNHRLTGPASFWYDGDMFWYQYGKLHRLDGPAEIFRGSTFYYINDIQYTKDEYDAKIRTLL